MAKSEKPVAVLSEKVTALNQALWYLKEVENFNPRAARSAARAVLIELRALVLR